MINLISRLTVDHLNGVATNAVNYVSSRPSLLADPGFRPVADKFRSEATQYLYSYNLITPDNVLKQMNDRRKKLVRLLFSMARNYAGMREFDEQTGAAGEKLAELTKHYARNFFKGGMTILTGKIESFITDVDAMITADDLELMPSVGRLIELLRQAHSEFLSAESNNLIALANKPASATKLKQGLLSCINDTLMPYISLRAELDGGEFMELYHELTGLIKDANSYVRERCRRIRQEADTMATQETEGENIQDTLPAETGADVQTEAMVETEDEIQDEIQVETQAGADRGIAPQDYLTMPVAADEVVRPERDDE